MISSRHNTANPKTINLRLATGLAIFILSAILRCSRTTACVDQQVLSRNTALMLAPCRPSLPQRSRPISP